MRPTRIPVPLPYGARQGLSLAAAVRVLGMKTRTISAYDRGTRPVSPYIALVCKDWEAEQQREERL